MALYYDSFAGLIPCDVLADGPRPGDILGTPHDRQIKLKCSAGPYKAGETLTVSRSQVVTKVRDCPLRVRTAP